MISVKWPLPFGCKFQFPDRSCFVAYLVQTYNGEPGQAESLQIQEKITHLAGDVLLDTHSLSLTKLGYNLFVIGELTTSQMEF